MNATQEQVKQAILVFARDYGKEANYQALMESNPGLPKIVEMIVYDMFINNFNNYYCSAYEYSQYKIIHEYSSELTEKGFVEFKSK